MFVHLSHQVTLIKQLNAYTDQEFGSAYNNITLVIESLNVEVSQLISYRREHGVLIPPTHKDGSLNDARLNSLSLQELLLNKALLIQAVNTLCLSEAIVVRNALSNCLETISEQKASIYNIIKTEEPVKINIEKPTDKPNISPIHLTQIKQRLAKANQETSDKQTKIKNKLNALLSQTQTDTYTRSKQA